MKTIKYLFACVLVLSIAMFSAPVSAENPYIKVYEDPIQKVPWGYIVRPSGDKTGYEVDYGSETLIETRDTTNLKAAIKNLEPGGTIKLLGGTYYISRVIICRKSINLIGAGMNHTTIVAKGPIVDGSQEKFPLMTEDEVLTNNFEGIRAPMVFRFSANDDSRKIKVACENFTVRTEGEAETWYRICDEGCDPPAEYKAYNSHMGVIFVSGDNVGTIDYKVSRVDAKFKNLRIQGVDDGVYDNTPRAGIFVVTGGKITLLGDPNEPFDYTADEGLDFQLEAVEPGTGVVEFEGCVFEHIKTYPIAVMGISSLPLPTEPFYYDIFPPISWTTDPTDQTPGIVKITGCTFNDTGNEPCAYSGWISNIVIWDLSNANLSITNNSFLNTTGMVAVIAGAVGPVGGGGGVPQVYMPLPYSSKCYINNNYMEFISGYDLDGLIVADYGPIGYALHGKEPPKPPPQLKTLDVNISGNRITFDRSDSAGAVLGSGLVNALFENNDIEGNGFAAIALDPAISCTLLKNKVDNFNAHVLVPFPPYEIDAPILLGPDSTYCTVIGLNLGETVLNLGTNNNLVDVQTATGGELGEAIRKIKSPKF